MHPRCATPALAARALLGLPPRLSTHVYRNARPRPPNPSQVRYTSDQLPKFAEQFPVEHTIATTLGEGCLSLSWGLLEALHNSGLPWVLALPASAFVVRAFIIVPLFQLPARKAAQANASLMPISQAFAVVKKHSAHVQHYDKGPRVAQNRAMRAITLYNYRIRKRWRAQRWRQMLPFLGLPVFLSMAESIRRMVGASSGLWGMAFGSGSYEAPKASDVLKEAPVPDGVINALDRVAEWKGTTSLPSSAPDTAILSEWLQPSLATEGMLWFPNLMVPDPLMILPFAVSGLTIASLYAGSRAPNKTKEKPAHTILKRVMMTFALAIGPLTLNMPAGILLYWSASTVCAFLTHVLLDMFRPIRMPPKPCKRTIPYSPRRKVVGAVKMARR